MPDLDQEASTAVKSCSAVTKDPGNIRKE